MINESNYASKITISSISSKHPIAKALNFIVSVSFEDRGSIVGSDFIVAAAPFWLRQNLQKFRLYRAFEMFKRSYRQLGAPTLPSDDVLIRTQDAEQISKVRRKPAVSRIAQSLQVLVMNELTYLSQKEFCKHGHGNAQFP
jgi:hypothetical protein